MTDTASDPSTLGRRAFLWSTAVAAAAPIMTEATLAQWLVEDGARVDQDQPVYVLETDKVETVITAPRSGVLHRIGEV